MTQKYAPDSSLLWSYTWNNPARNFHDYPNDMVVGPNGNVDVVGHTKWTDNFSDINATLFIFALDQNGGFLADCVEKLAVALGLSLSL